MPQWYAKSLSSSTTLTNHPNLYSTAGAGSVEVINSVAATDESAQLEKMTLGNNCDTDTEGEVDPDDQMIAEGRVKDEALLTQNGFDPIFIEGKYPGEIPEAIADYLPEDRTKPYWQMVGSNRSIFWIFGYNDIVDIIDDPACLLDDEIVGVPNGVHPASFLFARYASEDKLANASNLGDPALRWITATLPGFVLVRRKRTFDNVDIIVRIRYFKIFFVDIKPGRRQIVPFVFARLPHRKVSEVGILEDHKSSLRVGIFGSFVEVIGGVNSWAELVGI